MKLAGDLVWVVSCHFVHHGPVHDLDRHLMGGTQFAEHHTPLTGQLVL